MPIWISRQSFQSDKSLIITALTLVLPKTPNIRTDYPGLRSWLEEHNVLNPTPQDVARAVMSIRRAKLPAPAHHANVGSFFKNPVVKASFAKELQLKIPNLVVYELADVHQVKLSAAQLIDLAGCKEWQEEEVSCWEKQPLVLINKSASDARTVLKFAERIQFEVKHNFMLDLEIEPSVVG